MLNKIVVPTDFSANSKAGIRFAIQLASQNNATLLVYHCIDLQKPMRWTDGQYDTYVKKELEATRQQIVQFVDSVVEQSGMPAPKYEAVAEEANDPKEAIKKFAVAKKAGAICIGTRGAGKIKKIMGTNSSGILATSPVPVFVIPKTYRRSPITNVLYASDLDHLQKELKQVTEFAKPLKASIDVYHYNEMFDVPETRKKLSQTAEKYGKDGVKFNFQKFHIDKSFSSHLDADIKKSKASLAVLFTNQKRGWFDKLFQASRSAEVSFDSKVPLLVFAKD